MHTLTMIFGLALWSIPAWPMLFGTHWAWTKWRGGWRIVAMLPALVLAFVVIRILVDTAMDPTSHNLWPLEIILCSVFGLAVLGVLSLARWLTLRAGKS
tara:strand:- start:32145 stop:32441 length:297 start_codon:yes stop_codon:yes gene_type:complete